MISRHQRKCSSAMVFAFINSYYKFAYCTEVRVITGLIARISFRFGKFSFVNLIKNLNINTVRFTVTLIERTALTVWQYVYEFIAKLMFFVKRDRNCQPEMGSRRHGRRRSAGESIDLDIDHRYRYRYLRLLRLQTGDAATQSSRSSRLGLRVGFNEQFRINRNALSA